MKQQTKKEVWYWLIIGIGILLVITIGYGVKKDANSKKTVNNKNNNTQQTQISQEEDTQGTDRNVISNNDSDKKAIGGAGQNNYQQNQSGGELGQSYLLDNVSLSSGADFDKVKIKLLPENESKLPRWQASQKDSRITLSISDTSNYDIVTGSKTYQGPNILTGEERVKKVKIDDRSGGQVSAKIILDQGRVYQISKSLNPLRLVIKIY